MHEAAISAALAEIGDTSPIRERAVIGGGSISQAVRLQTARGAYLLKIGGRGLPGFFAAEARGLQLLAGTGAVRVPAVLAVHDVETTAADQLPTTQAPAVSRQSSVVKTGFILLEWLDAPPHASRTHAGELLGTALAAMHRTTAPTYGLDHDNYIGATPQLNAPHTSWLAFFRDQRLRAQAARAQHNGLLPATRAARIERLLTRLGEWLDDAQVQPSLLHGDLWGGNFIVGPGGAPALIDPAAYYGDREADLAMTRLFGGFPPGFYAAYQAAWPLPPGWQERVELYNLYHLLNHLNLFGEGYSAEVDAILQRYAG
ncbi:MAG: fructosamine kinase family protein [Kouleothrix sp.]